MKGGDDAEGGTRTEITEALVDVLHIIEEHASIC